MHLSIESKSYGDHVILCGSQLLLSHSNTLHALSTDKQHIPSQVDLSQPMSLLGLDYQSLWHGMFAITP